MLGPGATDAVEDVAPVLRVLVQGLRGALADQLVGVYLQVSMAGSGADEHSDVGLRGRDPGAVARRRSRRLQELHGRIYDLPDRWPCRLDGSYFPLGVLRTCDRRGEDLWYLDNGAQHLVVSDHCRRLRTHG
jgi:hypothetical protein